MVISLGCFVAGGILLLIASRNVSSHERRARWIKFAVYFAVVMTILATAQAGKFWLQLLMGTIIAVKPSSPKSSTILTTQGAHPAWQPIPGGS